MFQEQVSNLTPPKLLNRFIVSPKVKTTKGEKVGAHSLARNTSRVKEHARALRWGLGRLTSNLIIHTTCKNQTTSWLMRN